VGTRCATRSATPEMSFLRFNSKSFAKRWFSSQTPIILLKKLREATNAPMMECKAALASCEGIKQEDEIISKATEWLRKKGISTAARKSGRVTPEGIIALKLNSKGNRGVLVELNTETDFVSRNPEFYSLAAKAASQALSIAESQSSNETVDVSALTNTLGDSIIKLVNSTRENIQIRRASQVHVKEGVIFPYMHKVVDFTDAEVSQGSTWLGRVGVLLALQSNRPFKPEETTQIETTGKQIAMHLTAISPPPLFLQRDSVPQDLLKKEKEIILEQLKEQKKN